MSHGPGGEGRDQDEESPCEMEYFASELAMLEDQMGTAGLGEAGKCELGRSCR